MTLLSWMHNLWPTNFIRTFFDSKIATFAFYVEMRALEDFRVEIISLEDFRVEIIGMMIFVSIKLTTHIWALI